MQSKTSFFNKTVLRKDITRFAPVWGAYTLGLLLALLMIVINGGDERSYWAVDHMMYMTRIMAMVNCGYALVVAQLLFGDLYSARSCYGLHALPLRRETWYLSHLAAGLLFSLVPTAVLSLFALPIAASGMFTNGWQVPLVLFVTNNLQYLLFFSLAVIAAFCAGSRIGMIGIYGFVNFCPLLLGAAVDNICAPVLLGVQFPMEPYVQFAPIKGFSERIMFNTEDAYQILWQWREAGKTGPIALAFTHVTESWSYYGICTLVAVALLAIGLVLYRKRHLECAGDFLAFPCLKPVVTVLASVAVGLLARLVYTSFTAHQSQDFYLSLLFGLIAGWIITRMLLERTTRIFQRKNFRGLGAVIVVLAVAIGLVHLDPLGVETWVPLTAELESATFDRYGNTVTMTEPEDMLKITRLHELALEQHLDGDWSGGYERGSLTFDGVAENAHYGVDIDLSYKLKDGSEASRHYVVWADSEAGRITAELMSVPEVAFDRYYLEELEKFGRDQFDTVYVQNWLLPEEYSTNEEISSLLDALWADCEEGTMAQLDALHNGYFEWEKEGPRRYDMGNRSSDLRLNLRGAPRSDGREPYLYMAIYTDSKNTLAWLESRGLLETMGITVVETDHFYDPNMDPDRG